MNKLWKGYASNVGEKLNILVQQKNPIFPQII